MKGGTKNPPVTVYLREYCSNNPVGATVGYTVRGYQGSKLVTVEPGRGTARDRLHHPRARGRADRREEKPYRVTVDANTVTTASILRTITVVGA